MRISSRFWWAGAAAAGRAAPGWTRRRGRVEAGAHIVRGVSRPRDDAASVRFALSRRSTSILSSRADGEFANQK